MNALKLGSGWAAEACFPSPHNENADTQPPDTKRSGTNHHTQNVCSNAELANCLTHLQFLRSHEVAQTWLGHPWPAASTNTLSINKTLQKPDSNSQCTQNIHCVESAPLPEMPAGRCTCRLVTHTHTQCELAAHPCDCKSSRDYKIYEAAYSAMEGAVMRIRSCMHNRAQLPYTQAHAAVRATCSMCRQRHSP